MIDNISMLNKMTRVNELAGVQKPPVSSMLKNEVSTPFSSFLGAAMNNMNSTNEMVKSAEKMAVDFAVGRIDNPEKLMIEQEKASLAISYTTKVTNKVLEVYNEIMRMQI